MSEGPALDPSTDVASVESVVPDAMTVTVVSGLSKGTTYPLPVGLGATVRIGKADDNDFVLTDPGVSRYHLVLTRGERAIEVRDLGSTNGVFVGDARVSQGHVPVGTLIRVGQATLVLQVNLQATSSPISHETRFELALGQSLAMRRVFGVLEPLAPSMANVLLLGETGTGKDVLARSVHLRSGRAKGPFEVVDCGAITESLIESELFGHERGAFTGASATYDGAFARAQGGTLFLDEIGELPLALQPKLLRVLEARQFRRVGGSRVFDADVRIVAATGRDLLEEVEHGRFRQDLYFRLAVVTVHVPPLRERLDDLPLLAEAILHTQADARALELTPEFLASLRSHSWPGNVRELRNVLERAAHFAWASGEQRLSPVVMREAPRAGTDPFAFDEELSYREARALMENEFERRFVRWVLSKTGGNIAAAARLAKMNRKYLGELVRKHGRDEP